MDWDEMRERLRRLETSCLCDTDKSLPVMDAGMRPVRADLKMVGRALPVSCRDDFLTVLMGLRQAQPGDVLVVDGQGGTRALAGGMFTTEAARRGLAGIVVDGAVRDLAVLRQAPIPVYARSFCPVSGTTQQVGGIGVEVSCGGIPVKPGDVVFGDADGIVVAAPERLKDLIEAAEAILERESVVMQRMASGDSLFDMLTLDDHIEKVRAGEPSRLLIRLNPE